MFLSLNEILLCTVVKFGCMLVQESVHKKLSLVRTVHNVAINYAITAN